MFEEKFENVDEVPLPLHATVVEQDGRVVQFVSLD